MKLKTQVIFICILFLASGMYGQTKKLSIDSSYAEWFKEAKFGIFIHWGLYSILEGTYNGHTLPDTSFPQGKSWYAEWIQQRLEVPNVEYQALMSEFNPINFDADAWIKEVKDAGAKYFVITSKHHDGFALWDSKVSNFTVMHSPYKKDILKELVDACKKHRIKYGFYYSHWQDWEHPQGAVPEWKEQRTNEEFEKYWYQKCLPQVKELLTMFDPDLLWFDTWGTEGVHISPERRDELIALVRDNSEKCLINGRISFSNPGENIDFLEMMDNEYPDEILNRPWQTPATMVHSWGWHANDFHWKSSSQMIAYLVSNVSKGGNYLLNIGPKPNGEFPVPAVRRLREMGAWLYANNEAIYDSYPVKVVKELKKDIYLTQKEKNGKKLIHVILEKPMEKVSVPIKLGKIFHCKSLEIGMPVECEQINDEVILTLPKDIFIDAFPVVIQIETDNITI